MRYPIMLTISIAMLFLLEPVKAQGDDFLVCINDCDQLGRDYRFRNQVINQRRINQLPKWNNICQKLLKANLCDPLLIEVKPLIRRKIWITK